MYSKFDYHYKYHTDLCQVTAKTLLHSQKCEKSTYETKISPSHPAAYNKQHMTKCQTLYCSILTSAMHTETFV